MESSFESEKNKLALLKEAFSSFEGAASSLRNYYSSLERRVKSLDLELRRKNRELAVNLRETEKMRAFLQGILDNLATCVIRVDRYGVVRGANKAAETLMGLKQEALVGKKVNYVLGKAIPEGCPIELGNWRVRQFFELEVKIERSDAAKGVALMTLTPVKNRAGACDGSIIMLQDISALRKLEEQAERSRRLSAMAEMAKHFAHSVRNPLGSIELLSSLLMRELSDQESKAKLVAKLLAAVKNLNQYVSNLLIFTTEPRPDLKVLDLARCLREAAQFAMPIAEQNLIRIRLDDISIGRGLRGDAELLKQVFLNIIFNAIHAMPSGGDLVIGAKSKCPKAKLSQATAAGKPGLLFRSALQDGFCEVSFADSGTGIEKGSRDKIFNPFFTTRANGLGLGLAIAANIIKAHDGYIDLQSVPGRGSIFIVKLPLSRFGGARRTDHCKL